MNKVILCGRLTDDPVTRISKKGDEELSFTNFTIAINRRRKTENGPNADYFNCKTWGKTADVVGRFFKKGSRINVSGRLENDNWTDEHGIKHYNTVIAVDEVDIVDTKAESEANEKEPEVPTSSDNFIDVPEGIENDLPFK